MKKFFLAFCLLFSPFLFFACGAELVDINTAPLTQLDDLMGIGPALGQKIIDSRPYTSVDDLLKVQGIGPKNLEKIKQQGIACVNCQEMSTNTSTEDAETANNTKQITDNETFSTNPIPEQAVKPNPLPIVGITAAGLPYILINEILPSPEGPDTENEFIEIFNPNNFAADISGFKIKDKVGAVKTYTLPQGIEIKANGFLIFKSSQTKISLNNAGDGVELLNPNGKIIDSTDFGKSQPGQSWSKTESGWQWTAKPTPSQANIVVTTQTNISTNSAQTTSAQNTSQKTDNLTANIQNYSPQKKNLLAVGAATVIALSASFIAWRIKKKSTEI